MDHLGNREIWCSYVLEPTSQSSTKKAISTGICPQKILLKPNRKHTQVARPSKISPILEYQGSAPLLNQLVLRFPAHSDLYLKEKRAQEVSYLSIHILTGRLSNYDVYCHEDDDDDFDDGWIKNKIDLDFHFRPSWERLEIYCNALLYLCVSLLIWCWDWSTQKVMIDTKIIKMGN